MTDLGARMYAFRGVSCSKEEMAQKCGVPIDELDSWLDGCSAGEVAGQYGGVVSALASAYQGEIQHQDMAIEQALDRLRAIKHWLAIDNHAAALKEVVEAIEILEEVEYD